ncbi:hypothetical protein NDU88_005329 [Pleurodeles waltl]|uniref:Uncharacterized protein n=1 Tax=Pleurodeles waltl TaxID=8319 RepID=A0AAV7N0X2_PLEWA|nr:hypothetical protein NDU88_005329 [Pleurodeles waltl]
MNERASQCRRAVEPRIQVGDQDITRDRQPGWKYHTPFTREVWEVVKVKGTMVTAKSGLVKVSGNVSWFKKIREGRAGLEEQVVDDDLGGGDTQREDEEGSTMEPDGNDSRESPQLPLQGRELPAEPREVRCGHPYQRRENPQLSQRIKDFFC